MRDPQQLEFNFDGSKPELTTAELDAAVAARLERMRVCTHLNAVSRGHKVWSDLNRPTTDELVRYGQYLLDNPDDLGNQYSVVLRQEIDQRISEMLADMPVVDFEQKVEPTRLQMV